MSRNGSTLRYGDPPTDACAPTARLSDGSNLAKRRGRGHYRDALILLNSASALSNLSLNSHMASRISRKVADVLARSTCPNVKTLLLRKYPITVGSEILQLERL